MVLTNFEHSKDNLQSAAHQFPITFNLGEANTTAFILVLSTFSNGISGCVIFDITAGFDLAAVQQKRTRCELLTFRNAGVTCTVVQYWKFSVLEYIRKRPRA
jgi:hypothetical protein